LDKPSESTIDRVAKELDSAFSTVGFVYLKNHGIEQQKVKHSNLNFYSDSTLKLRDKVDNVFRASQSFFQLPDAIKDEYRCGQPDNESDGYTGKDQEM
jgi:isopenicillin N synthase-like dioxygenase